MEKRPGLLAVLLIFVQMATGMRDMPQMAFFLIYLQEKLGLAPEAISSIVAGAQIAGMVTGMLGGTIAARLGSKWVLVAGLAVLRPEQPGLSDDFAGRGAVLLAVQRRRHGLGRGRRGQFSDPHQCPGGVGHPGGASTG